MIFVHNMNHSETNWFYFLTTEEAHKFMHESGDHFFVCEGDHFDPNWLNELEHYNFFLIDDQDSLNFISEIDYAFSNRLSVDNNQMFC